MVKEFIIHQANHFQRDGFSVLFKKINTALKMVFTFLVRLVIVIIYIPVYILLLVLSPFIYIRLGELESRAIGHFSLSVEIYLAEQRLGIHKVHKKYLDIWFINKKIANNTLLQKWKAYFTIVPRFLIEPLFRICRWAPGGKRHLVPYRHWLDRDVNNKFWQITDVHDVLDQVEPMVRFSALEVSDSEKDLSSIGITDAYKYVCFYARNPGYLGETEFGPRDSSINSQVPAMLELTKIGYKAVRVGSVVSEKLDRPSDKIIDYPTSGKRSELLDLFLISRCRFMVSTASGIDCIATMFRRPTLYVNVCDFGCCQAWNGKYIPLFIMKKFRCINEERVLTFTEIYKNGIDLFANPDRFENTGITWLENTPDEIRDVTLEMESRLSGTWIDTEEDSVLQKIFWNIFSKYRGAPPPSIRVGSSFLRQNQYLLQ